MFGWNKRLAIMVGGPPIAIWGAVEAGEIRPAAN